MTTIVYRDGVLAADSRNMIGGWKAAYPITKLFRLADGSVMGGCGLYAKVVAFRDWLGTDRSSARPDLDETTVIHLTRTGIVVHEAGGGFPITTEFGAWGSGAPPAYGALHMGASAEKAVEIAALVDDSTGGAIVSMRCE